MISRTTSMENLFQIVNEAKENNIKNSEKKEDRTLSQINDDLEKTLEISREFGPVIDKAKKNHSIKELRDFIFSVDPNCKIPLTFFGLDKS